jgi:NAD(P)H-dependent flavin oxidoreductase YrpB (nitropropane dioxygenase family)
MADPLHTVLCERLGCRYPVIQTAMGWVATPRLVAAACEAGAFGFLAGAVMTPSELRAAIARLKATTDRPFGVNFHMFQPGAEEIVEIVIAEKIRAVSFGRGPDAAMIRRFRDAGVICIPTVGALKHAIKMAELGCDMLTMQGGEGGGHTGAVSTTVLLPQVLDAVSIPVVAAGGFSDGRGLAAALAYGACGIAMGTRFLLTQESPVPEAVKARYLEAGPERIIVSWKVDGVPQRMVRNSILDRIERAGPAERWLRALDAGLKMKRALGLNWIDLLKTARGLSSRGGLGLAQSLMAASAPILIQKAVVDGDADGGLMASGQVAGRITDLPTAHDLMERIVAEARARLDALTDTPQPLKTLRTA